MDNLIQIIRPNVHSYTLCEWNDNIDATCVSIHGHIFIKIVKALQCSRLDEGNRVVRNKIESGGG